MKLNWLVILVLVVCMAVPSVMALGEACTNVPADNCTTTCEFCNTTTSVCEISNSTMDNKSECSAFSCNNTYLVNNLTGLCNGTTAVCNSVPTGLFNVSAGKVCANGTNYSTAPTSAVKCSSWYYCIADNTTYGTYYVGYAGDGSTDCDQTGWVYVTNTAVTSGRSIRTTANSSSVCVLMGYGYTYEKSDFQNIVVDGLGTAGASFVDVAELIIIALVLSVAVGLMVKIKKH